MLVAPRGAVVCALLVSAAFFNSATALVRWGKRAKGAARPGALVTVRASLVLAVFTVTGNIGVASALAVQKAAVTSVFLQTQVLIVAVFGWLWLGERVGPRFIVGVVLSIGGFVVMNLPALGAVSGQGVNGMGVVWALTAAASFALMQVYTRGVIEDIDTVVVNALRLWLAVAVYVLFPGNLGMLLALDSEVWFYCAAAAFLGPFLSRLCLMEAVRTISAARVALVIMINPIFAAALGFAAFGSMPSGLESAGAALILVGVSAPLLTALSGPGRR